MIVAMGLSYIRRVNRVAEFAVCLYNLNQEVMKELQEELCKYGRVIHGNI